MMHHTLKVANIRMKAIIRKANIGMKALIHKNDGVWREILTFQDFLPFSLKNSLKKIDLMARQAIDSFYA
jgi:hypothetical protein